MKKTIILLCILINGIAYSQISNEQNINRLKAELKSAKHDTTKINILNRLSIFYYYIDSQKSYQYTKSAYELSKKIDYSKGIANSYDNFGIYFYLKSDFPKALKFIYRSLHINETINNKKGIADSNNSLGIVYVEFKNYKLALACYNKALKASQEINDRKSIATYLNNIGDVYLRMKEYQKALRYFDNAIKLNAYEKTSDESGINYTNIGITLNFLNQYKKSIEATNKSILIYNDDNSLFNAYNKLELGKSYYYLSLEEKNEKERQNLLKKSLDYTNESMSIFKREQSLIDIRDAYLYLSRIYMVQKKHKQALNYYEKSTALNDSIFSNENKTQIAFLKSQREIDLRNKKIEIQNLKIKNESRKVYLLYTITLTVLILFGLFFWLYLSKRKTNQQLKEKNKTILNISKQKDKFFSIIAHDLRGPFNGFLGLTELMAEDLDVLSTEEIKFAAVNMRSSAKNLFNLLENLLEWSRMEQGLIPFDPKEYPLKQFVSDSILTLRNNADKKEINININISKSIKIFADKNMLQAIIRNLVLNAIKFTHKNGTIDIQAEETPANTIITVRDTGIGMDSKMMQDLFKLEVQTNRNGTEEEPSTGLGLILCKEFIEKHHGKIRVESEEGIGSTFYLSFPNEKLSLI